MLEIEVVLDENFDETTNMFVVGKSVKVRLEHSLVSLSKWESVWEEPFLGKEKKTTDQTISYIEMMLVDEIPREIFHRLLEKHIEEIQVYVNSPMNATKLPKTENKAATKETITAELIYYWMAQLNVPFECEHWHLTRLFTLIQVINIKNTPQKKMSAAERQRIIASQRERYNTRG
jgi:hypothetical protein